MKAAQSDIFKFCRILRFNPTDQQAWLLKTVQEQTRGPLEHRKKGIAVKSGQGPGKTTASTIPAMWRALQAFGERTIVTAPTMRQVRDVWMTELGRRVHAADPDFQRCVDVSSVKALFFGLPKWGIFTATSTRPENLQGYHGAGMTIIVDEASGVPRPIWQAIKGTLTGPRNLVVAIGNPNDRDTEFFDMFGKDIENYVTTTWSAEDSPNVSKKHIAEMEREYGRESDVFRVRVLGEFPRENPNAVIRYEDLLYCSKSNSFNGTYQHLLETDGEAGSAGAVRQFGIDLARFGSDESVVVARCNGAVVGIRVYVKREPADVIAEAFQWQRELAWKDSSTYYCVDGGGMGQGVMHLFHEAGKNMMEFHTQGNPIESHAFHDALTEAYFVLRRLTRTRKLFLRTDSTLFTQLVSRQYRYTDGKFRLESKDEFLKRVGCEEYSSPDRADALAMAFYPFAAGGLQTLPVG